MADSELTESETLNQESKEAAREEESKESERTEPDKKKTPVGAKVEVRLQAAGDAPIMKQRNYNVSDHGNKACKLSSFSYRLIERKVLVGSSLSSESI